MYRILELRKNYCNLLQLIPFQETEVDRSFSEHIYQTQTLAAPLQGLALRRQPRGGNGEYPALANS